MRQDKKTKTNRSHKSDNYFPTFSPCVEVAEKEDVGDYQQQLDRDKKMEETKSKFNLASYALASW